MAGRSSLSGFRYSRGGSYFITIFSPQARGGGHGATRRGSASYVILRMSWEIGLSALVAGLTTPRPSAIIF